MLSPFSPSAAAAAAEHGGAARPWIQIACGGGGRLRPKWRQFSKLAFIKWRNDSRKDRQTSGKMNLHTDGQQGPRTQMNACPDNRAWFGDKIHSSFS